MVAHDRLIKALKGRNLDSLSHDEWDALIEYETSEAIGEWLIQGKNLSMPLQSLTRSDLKAIANAVVVRFVQLTASAKILERPLSPDINLIMGG